MRRLAVILAALLVLTFGLAIPAVGAPAQRNGDVWFEFPIVPEVDNLELLNPCTGEIVTYYWEGVFYIHEFERPNGWHTNIQFFGDGYTSDGYVTDAGMHAAVVSNGSGNVEVYKDNSNYQYNNEAGSKFRMTYSERWTVVDGEVVTERLTPTFECVHYRG